MNNQRKFILLATVGLAWGNPLSAQMQLSGRVLHPRYDGAPDVLYLSTILCFASKNGQGAEARSFRTWETHPAGWYLLTGDAGNYTLGFAHPSHFFRPVLLNNIWMRHGEKLSNLDIRPSFDYACFDERAWDRKAATDYYQPFVAKGKSLTSVGFKLAHDGVDGHGPGGQNLTITIHRQGPGAPDQWRQVGPAATVLNVDCGGAKNYTWSAGWNSGEVPLAPGETYAVHFRSEKPGGVFQPFWHEETGDRKCYRLDQDSAGYRDYRLWMAVGSDQGGLVIPYNKKVHKQFTEFAGFASKWTQTYVAQGRSLGLAILYAAVGGAQPPLSRQRAVVRVRSGGPHGPQVGLEKIAIGNGNYTGDASWGVFGAAFAPGEVPLVPGETYAIEWESLENYETLHGFVNIKGQVSDDRPGFNPYRKVPPDDYRLGAAFKLGKERMDFNLDLQIVEYASASPLPLVAASSPNLLRNGTMEDSAESLPADWQVFAREPGTRHAQFADGPQGSNHTARVIGGSATGTKADGGFVQQVKGLSRLETYELSGKVRSSWPVDPAHKCFIGFDPTGQVEDSEAATIQWTILPPLHGIFVDYASDPIRPQGEALSVWLRGWTSMTNDYRFTADFDDLSLRRVRTVCDP